MKSKQLLAILLSSSLFLSGACLNVSASDPEDQISNLEAICNDLKETDANREYKRELDELLNSFKDETERYIKLMNTVFKDESEFKGATTIDEINKFANFYLDNLLEKTDNEDQNPTLTNNIKYITDILENRSKVCEELLQRAEDLIQSAKDADAAALIALQEQIKAQAEPSNRLKYETIRILNNISVKATPEYNDNSDSSEEIFTIRSKDYHLIATKKERHKFTFNRQDMEWVGCRHSDLFRKEPCVEDIKQGKLGDCYFLSALGAIVNSHHEIIKNSIKDNGDGTITVRFYDEKQKPCYYTIDKTVPREFARQGNRRRKSWVILMEKAYVLHIEHIEKMHPHANTTHDYKIIDGGSSCEAMAHITGSSDTRSIDLLVVEKESDKIGKYSPEITDRFSPLFKQWVKNNICCASNHGHGSTSKKINLYKDHSYAILGFKETKTSTGKNLFLVKLRNPWGHAIPHYEKNKNGTYTLEKCKQPKDGIFLLDMNHFLKYFNKLSICYLPK